MSKHRYQLLETKTLKRMTDKLEFVFVEVAKFNKREDELETDLDKWLYLLKNMSAALRDRVFGRLCDLPEYARLDDEERNNYVNAMNTARDTYNQMVYACKVSVKKNTIEIAQKMIALGIDFNTISSATGLTMEEITGISENIKEYIDVL